VNAPHRITGALAIAFVLLTAITRPGVVIATLIGAFLPAFLLLADSPTFKRLGRRHLLACAVGLGCNALVGLTFAMPTVSNVLLILVGLAALTVAFWLAAGHRRPSPPAAGKRNEPAS
jgi:hypothetical protein